MALLDIKRIICRKGVPICMCCGAASFFAAVVLYLFVPELSFGTPFTVNLGICFWGYGWLLRQAGQGRFCFLMRCVNQLLLLGAISFLVVEFFVFQGMKTELPVKCRYVIVLGAGLMGDNPSPMLRERLDAALFVLRKNPEARVIASGGVGKESAYSEAAVMKWYLMERGVGEERIVMEEQATRTDENLKFGKRVIKERYGEEMDDLVIATSDYHMFRSKLLARKYCTQVYGISAESPFGVRVNYALREYFALAKMGALEGYSWAKEAVRGIKSEKQA